MVLRPLPDSVFLTASRLIKPRRDKELNVAKTTVLLAFSLSVISFAFDGVCATKSKICFVIMFYPLS
jgi:hypothetical protein